MVTQTSMFTTEEQQLQIEGFTPDEITSLEYLRQEYMSSRSDRHEVVRRFEFVKQLIATGRLSEQC